MLPQLKSTFKNTLIYSLGNLSSKLVGFVLIPLYTNHFATSEYGILSIIEITSQILLAVFGLSLYAALMRWYWDVEKEKQKSVFFSLLFIVIAFSLLLGSVLFVYSRNISSFLLENESYSGVLRFMFVTAALEATGILPATLMRLQEKPVLFSVSNITKLTVNLVLTVYFIRNMGMGLEGIYLAQMIGISVYFVITSGYILNNIRLKFEMTLLKEMLIYSSPLIISAISGLILNITDRYTLRFMSTLSEVGIYSLAFKISNTVKVFIINSIMLAVSPMIFKMINNPENKRFYSKILTYITFISMLFVLGLSFFGQELIKFLSARTDYWESIRLVPVISFAILLSSLKDISLTGLQIKKQSGTIALLVLTMMVFNILLNVLFISLWDAMGAAVSVLITQLIFFGITMYYSQKTYFIPYELRKIALIFITGAILVIVSSGLISSLGLITRLILKTVLLITFPFLLYVFGFYEAIEKERLAGFWHKWRNPVKWKKNLSEIVNPKDKTS